MVPTKLILQLFLGYISLMLFGTIWLCTKYLSDLADCKGSVGFNSEFPHQNGKAVIDPWNVNDHPVSYANSYVSQKKRRGPVISKSPIAMSLSNGKKFMFFTYVL